MEIRQKDILFTLVVIPAAAVAAYVFAWRGAAESKAAGLAARSSAMVAEEDFPMRRRRAEERVAEARAALEAEKAKGDSATFLGTAQYNASLAERERAALAAFRASGLDVRRTEATKTGENAASSILAAAVPGLEPTIRRFTLDGAYPGLKRALDTFAGKRAAVIPERIRLVRQGIWEMEVAL